MYKSIIKMDVRKNQVIVLGDNKKNNRRVCMLLLFSPNFFFENKSKHVVYFYKLMFVKNDSVIEFSESIHQ